jgi:Predicted pyridoxal phosphate-dependent enzyme apparently involved in regulation of cell wall biogenesis
VTIPLVDVHSQYEPLIPELEARFREVLDGGQFIRGPHYKAFEEEAAAYLGVKRSIGVANGTDALVLVLDALEIARGTRSSARRSPFTRPPSRSPGAARRRSSRTSTP